MKNVLRSICYKLGLLQLTLISGIAAFAQDSSANSTSSQTVVTHNSSTVADNSVPAAWYTAPWVWVVAAVILIVILYAIFKGNNNNSRTEVTRTVKTSTEVKND